MTQLSFNKVFVEIKGKIINIDDLEPKDYDLFLDYIHTLRKNKIEKLFKSDNKKPVLMHVYDKKDAPPGTVFLYDRIERNGVIDLSVPTYDLLKPGEKRVYFFELNP